MGTNVAYPENCAALSLNEYLAHSLDDMEKAVMLIFLAMWRCTICGSERPWGPAGKPKCDTAVLRCRKCRASTQHTYMEINAPSEWQDFKHERRA